MSRCILVSGLPLLPRTFRSKLAKQIDFIIRKACDVYVEASADNSNAKSNANNKNHEKPAQRYPPKIQISVNRNHRIDETVRLIFPDQVNPQTVQSLCQTLQETAALNPIEIPFLGTNGNKNKDKDEPCTTTTTFVPTYSLGAGSIRDHAFPSMPWDLRRQIQCDSVGVMSLTHERAANRMAKLLRCFLDDPEKGATSTTTTTTLVVDGMAGVGGNTMGFLNYWESVLSLELDQRRCSMLQENLRLWKQWRKVEQLVRITSTVRNMCLIDFLADHCRKHKQQDESITLPGSTVLFLDPPWAAENHAQYKEKLQEQDGDIVVRGANAHGQGHPHEHSPSHIVDCAVDWSFSKVVCDILESKAFLLVAMKVPNTFDEMLVVNHLVHNNDSLTMERAHPFRFRFGGSTKLIVLVRNHNGCDPRFANGPQGLDRIIRNIMRWHNSNDLQSDDGCREHRPEFYDWEKRRWIKLKNWLGSTASSNTE